MKLSYFCIFVILVIFVGILALFGAKNAEVTEADFETYEELASAKGIFDAGWIPVWIPQSAKKIKEAHDIDTNQSFLSFEFSPSEAFWSHCEPIDVEQVKLPEKRMLERFGGFAVMALDVIRIGTDVKFYRCEENTEKFLAIETNENRAHVWQLSM